MGLRIENEVLKKKCYELEQRNKSFEQKLKTIAENCINLNVEDCDHTQDILFTFSDPVVKIQALTSFNFEDAGLNSEIEVD